MKLFKIPKITIPATNVSYEFVLITIIALSFIIIKFSLPVGSDTDLLVTRIIKIFSCLGFLIGLGLIVRKYYSRLMYRLSNKEALSIIEYSISHNTDIWIKTFKKPPSRSNFEEYSTMTLIHMKDCFLAEYLGVDSHKKGFDVPIVKKGDYIEVFIVKPQQEKSLLISFNIKTLLKNHMRKNKITGLSKL